MKILKVSSKSSVPSLAGSIVKSVEEGNEFEVHCIGASSVNQGVKSIITARGILSTQGIDLQCIPSFGKVVINDYEKTLIKFTMNY